MKLVSPVTGQPLEVDTPHSLAAPGERWPVVDGIPYLRTDSEGLVAVALDHLDAGCPDDALVALLTDQDAWWTGPATDLGELKHLVRDRDTLSLREAMASLRFGPVADYFAYRWSDPTYLAGLALLEAHWNEPKTAFELACGIGHYLRELTRRGVACVGADVVFAKCWLAKHWVAPNAEYIVFDAASRYWPVAGRTFDLVQCHDAFYFLPEQQIAAAMLRGITESTGVLAISHLHNSTYVQGAKGPARMLSEWRALFPSATIYAEADLLVAMMEGRHQDPIDWLDQDESGGVRVSDGVEAFSLAEDRFAGGCPGRVLDGGLVMPVVQATLRQNPLWVDGEARWPSERYREEYQSGCLWALSNEELWFPADSVRLRRVVDLPERW